jgi:beta-mannosidase
MELGAHWRAAEADEDARRAFADDAYDDSRWEPMAVPGHWRSNAAFAASDGPLLYRTRFEAPPAGDGDGERVWLVLDGIFYQGDVWLDGGYLGDTEGYFFPHSFEVTDAIAARREHVLAVEVACAPQRDRAAKRNLTGVFQHWDCLDPDWNPGGIWRPVHLERTGPVRVRGIRAVCREATAERAVVAIRALLESATARDAQVRTTIAGVEHAADHALAAGENRVEWTVAVAAPELWWPRALGAQPLHDLTVEVSCDGVRSHRRTVRTGLRTVQLRNWICAVNGERLFLKGTNLGPTRMALGEATPDELRRDIGLAADAGLDFVRVHAHVSRPELYDAADEAGMLVWQDLPLQWGYARGIRKQATRQARAAVDLLGHHPSVAIWCAHNEPIGVDVDATALADPARMARVRRRTIAAQELPTWNKTVLDRSLKRALEKADGSRPVIAHSGVLPHPPQFDGTDSHLYFGWYWGDERDFPRFCATVPRMARFVSEFGAQSVPDSADFCEPARWPHLDWERLGHRHALQKAPFDRYVPPADYATFDEWRAATQAYQASVVKHHVETLRRLKYRPTGGFAQFCFADAMPAVTWSVLGHDRAPKLAYAALAAACRPVAVIADRLPATVAPGDPLALDVHVVSDLRTPVEGVVAEARLTWSGGGHTWRWSGDVAADGCVWVGAIQFVVPASAADPPATLRLVLTLTGAGDEVVTNEYEAAVTPTR